VRKITDWVDGNYTTTYGYDEHNRLATVSAPAFSRTYGYDAWGNLTNHTASGQGETGSYSLSYATNASGAPLNNRINNAGYSYDAAGNMTNAGSYAYDAANRMKTAGGVTNDYDGDGNRVKHANGSGTLFYLWSSVLGEPVAEVTSGGTYRAYVYGPGGGQILAQQSYDGLFYWVHTDHLGSGRKLTNTSGAVAYRGEFDPHGQTLLEIPTGSYLNSHKFTGYERDWATGLDHAKARTYHHNKGRFMQADPLGLGAADATDPQSLNRYSYVGNDPVNFVDPTGMYAIAFCNSIVIGQKYIEGIGELPVVLISCDVIDFGGGGRISPLEPPTREPSGPIESGEPEPQKPVPQPAPDPRPQLQQKEFNDCARSAIRTFRRSEYPAIGKIVGGTVAFTASAIASSGALNAVGKITSSALKVATRITRYNRPVQQLQLIAAVSTVAQIFSGDTVINGFKDSDRNNQVLNASLHEFGQS